MLILEFYLYFNFIAFLTFFIWYINTAVRGYAFFFSNLLHVKSLLHVMPSGRGKMGYFHSLDNL